MTDKKTFDFTTFNPQSFTSTDFTNIGLPAFTLEQNPQSSGDDFFNNKSEIHFISSSYTFDQANFTIAKLSFNNAALSAQQFHREVERKYKFTLGVRRRFTAITIAGHAAIQEEIIPVVPPDASRISVVSIFISGIYFSYDLGTLVEDPTPANTLTQSFALVAIS